MLPPPPPDAAPTPTKGTATDYNKIYAVRVVTWFCTLVMFSVAASIDNYNNYEGWKFVLAIGVIAWVYLTLLVGNFIGSNYAHHEIMPVDMVEQKFCKPVDAAMLFFVYTATICASVESSECKSVTGYDPGCSKFAASATFSWFASFGFLATMVVRDPAAFMKLVKGGASDNYDDIDAPSSILPPTGTSKPEQKVVDL
ncbi:hypothetical protein TL16_g09237 [Triparma laevis f. inornata]|uniref:MARVEL domain-containing protein n=2 Tax=Triparma laevis TaxID=1534972 RepID=A0A9W6ZAN5_9STRA|nr:hypothetical protein TrLO_g9558 [Triparma laevis f. longispina]GMH82385.1 hypothetical protein TL16_g09237 [Triparma laevis f. inornata]